MSSRAGVGSLSGLRSIHIALAVFVASLISTFAIVRWHTARSDAIADAHFGQIVADVDKRLHARMSVYENALSAMRSGAVLAGVPNVSRASFRRSVEWTDLPQQFPGAHGLGLIRRVPSSDDARFLAAARRDGAPNFAVRQLYPHDGDRYVIQYVEPQAKNQSAIGLDIASDPVRKQAADDAMRTGYAIITAPITLVQATGKPQNGFLLLLPIYLPYASLSTPEERDVATTAWAYVPILMDDVLDDFKSDPMYSLALRDSAIGSKKLFFSSLEAAEPASAGVTKQKQLKMYGRTWELELRSRPAFIASLNITPPELVAILGLAVSGLLASLSYLYSQATQRRAEILAEQARRAAIVGSSSDAVIAETLDGLITDWNPAAERLFGYTTEQAVGRSTIRLTVPEDLAAEATEVRAMVGRGECPKPFDSLRRAADGRLIHVSITISPIIAANGERVGLSKTIRDVTDAKRAERAVIAHSQELEREVSERTAALASTLEQLRRTTERMTLATDGAKIGVWELEMTTQLLSWDTWMYRLYGQEPGAGNVPARIWTDAVHPDDRSVISAELDAAQRGEREFDCEFRIVWPNGELRFLRASARVIRDEAGAPLRMTGVNFDITARKQAELKMQGMASLLNNVLEAASEVSLIATDPQMTINVFNRGAEHLLGYSASELVGRATPLVIHDPLEVQQRARELSAGPAEDVPPTLAFTHPMALKVPREWTYVRKDGSRVSVSLVVTEMRSANGEVFGYLGVAHDVTQQKEYEASLKEATRRAEDANRAKSEFLANMSHEIRTPMNAVIGVAHLLGTTSLDTEQADLLAKIQVASKALLGLLNDVLDLSKIEAGELKLEHAAFSLPQLLEGLRGGYSLQAEHKGVRFDFEAAADLPTVLEGDVVRLNQVLSNLLTNACKFTVRGSFQLRASCVSRSASQAELRFDIADTGIGMTGEQVGRLFSPFQQADSSTTRRFGGTGLGLSIVKRLVKLMNGHIHVESQPGRGSCFSVRLPFEVARPNAVYEEIGAREALSENPLKGIRVLVVDDSDMNQFVASRILEHAGAHVALACNGEEAVKKLADAPEAFDIVLMDLQMPIMDGPAAASYIRGPLGLTSLPLVALTADARSSERANVLAAGMNDFVSKPFEPNVLIRRLLKLVSSEAPPPSCNLERVDITASSWPAIAGVDLSLAQRRLGDDKALFLACVRRLVAEFVPMQSPALGELTTYAQRMHRLRGSAGQIGAEVIRALAEESEAAARAGSHGAALALRDSLCDELDRLAQSVAVERGPVTADAVRGRSGAPDVSVLLKLLEGRELAALAEAERLKPELGAWLGDLIFGRLESLLEALAFGEAGDVLKQAIAATTSNASTGESELSREQSKQLKQLVLPGVLPAGGANAR